MAKVIKKGFKEDGTIDTEVVSTPVLITQLIAKLPNMCEAAICKELEEIRRSAEQDERIRKCYVEALKEHGIADEMKAEIKKAKAQISEKMRGSEPKREKEVIIDGIDAIRRCVKNHDMESAVAIIKLCKAIAGDRFKVEVEV